jgi:phenylpyruvate tautomerase PptA (4-oxalocrotonate tautomerase family)
MNCLITCDDMAQVKIFGLRRSLHNSRTLISQAIHSSVVEAFQYPPDKLFHRFIPLDDEDFIYPRDRSDRYIIEISIFEGRSAEAKKLLIRLLFERIPQLSGISTEDIEITIFETSRQNWGIRGMPGDEIRLNYRVEV